jgi:hypothetical protein
MAVAAIAGAAISASGGVFGIVSGLKAAKEAKRIAKRSSAAILSDAAEVIVDRDRALSRLGMQAESLLGAQEAAQSAGGANPDFGSAANVRRDTSYFAALDELTIRENAARQVTAMVRQAEIVRRGGNIQASAAQASSIGEAIGLVGSTTRSIAFASQSPRRGEDGVTD